MTTDLQNKWPELPSLIQRLKDKFGDQADMVVAKTLFMGNSPLKGQLSIDVHPYLVEHTIRLALKECSNNSLSKFFTALAAQKIATFIDHDTVNQVVKQTITALSNTGSAPNLKEAI